MTIDCLSKALKEADRISDYLVECAGQNGDAHYQGELFILSGKRRKEYYKDGTPYIIAMAYDEDGIDIGEDYERTQDVNRLVIEIPVVTLHMDYETEVVTALYLDGWATWDTEKGQFIYEWDG